MPDRKANTAFKKLFIVQRPDRLRLETLTFLGAILIVTANDKEIIGFHPREGVFVRGAPTKENLRRYTQIPLELKEITTLLSGLPPVDANATPTLEGNTLIFAQNGRKRDALTFDLQQPVPSKWERFNAEGKVELSAQFSNYVSTPAGLFPQRIVFEAPLQKKKVEIRYQEPEINGTIPAELFSQQKPANAQEVPIEAVGIDDAAESLAVGRLRCSCSPDAAIRPKSKYPTRRRRSKKKWASR